MSDKDWDWLRVDSEEVFLTKSDILFAWILFATLALGVIVTSLGFAWLIWG